MWSFWLEAAQDTKFFPKTESTNEGWGGVSLYDLALKLLSTPPFADTLETVGVVAVGQDPKAALAGVGFLIDHLHADPTYHVLAALHSERELHVLLMGLNARLEGGRDKRQSAAAVLRDSTVKVSHRGCLPPDLEEGFVNKPRSRQLLEGLRSLQAPWGSASGTWKGSNPLYPRPGELYTYSSPIKDSTNFIDVSVSAWKIESLHFKSVQILNTLEVEAEEARVLQASPCYNETLSPKKNKR